MTLSSPRRLGGIALVAALVILYGWRLGVRSFWEPDESRYAEVGREMLVSGDWVTPRLDYLLYYEKPPLAYWSAAAGFALFGTNEASGRLGPAAFALLFIAGTWVLSRTLFGARAALAACAVLALSPLTWVTGRLLVTDMFLSAGVVWVLAGYACALAAARRGAGTVLPMCVAGAGAAIALLAKGPIGILLPLFGIVPFHLWSGLWSAREARIGWRGWAAAGALCALLGLPWFVLVSWRDPSFLTFFVWHEHVLRFFTHEAKREGAPWYYLGIILAGMFPVSLLLPWATVRHWPRLRAKDWESRGAWFLLLFGGAVLAFFSVSQSKLPGYILPALPVAAILVGRALASAWSEGSDHDPATSRRRWGLRASFGLAAIATLALSVYALAAVRRPPARLAEATGMWGPGIILAILAASLALPALQGGRAALRGGLVAATACLFAALLSVEMVAERLDASLSVKPAALIAARHAGPSDRIASYGTVLQGLTFYAARRTVIVGGPGELELGSKEAESAGWILPSDDLPDLVGKGTVYLVVPRGLEARALDRGLGHLRVLEETPAYAVLTNEAPLPPHPEEAPAIDPR